VSDSNDLLARRRALLAEERELRDAGRLLSLVGVLGLFGFVVWSTFVWLGSSPPLPATVSAWMAIVLCLPQILVGRSLSRLTARSVVPVRLVSLLSLPAYPHGTLVGGWLLYHLREQRMRDLLTDEHAALVAATPELDPERGNGPIVLGVMFAMGMLAFGAFSAMVV